MDSCIFCKIIKGDLPSTKLFEDEKVLAIKDIHPVRPFHVLVIPKEHVKEFAELTDDTVLVAIKNAIQSLISEHKLDTQGYRVEANGGGAQLVDHLHFHLMSPMEKPV
jgi:histidine triad (HIT) family protein